LIRNEAKLTAAFRPGITTQIEDAGSNDSGGSSRLQPTERVSKLMAFRPGILPFFNRTKKLQL